ncbi:hypothetical protein [Acidovorax sp.]|uniref:hypothetical protein n=1 Tax=Acidovorax sp. TaxID=1872122 RepID=UPI0025C198FB|nr:hypothetical protein [Acidovorax sp.]
MSNNTHQTPELQAVLQNQQAVAGAQATVDQLNQAIEAQNKLAEQLRSRAERVAALETQREDLLADIATGQDKAAELNALDERLAQEKKDIAKKGSQAAIEQTVAGLNRKLERAQSELAALQQKRPALMRALLRAQAEALGPEYVAAAFALKALHHRLRGLNSMLSDLGSVPSLIAGHSLVIEVPAPQLETVKPHVDYINPNMLVAREHDNRNYRVLIDKEKAALRELGVEIS